MRYLNIILFLAASTACLEAEEMPLPFSSSDLVVDGPVSDDLPFYQAQKNELSNAYSPRSLQRFSRKESLGLAQATEFPTDYMDKPPLDEAVAKFREVAESIAAGSGDQPADIPAAPNAAAEDVPPAPTAEEIQQMFGGNSGSAPVTQATPPVMYAPSQVQLYSVPTSNGSSCTQGCTQ